MAEKTKDELEQETIPQEDVDAENEDLYVGKTHREIMMEKIVSMRGERPEEDEEETIEEMDVDVDEEPPEDDLEEEDLEPAEEDEEAEDEPDIEDEDLVTLKVDGHEKKVPRDEVFEAGRRALQKESTADKRLAEVADRRKQLDELEARLQEQQARLREATTDFADNIGSEITEAMFDDGDKAAKLIDSLAAEVRSTRETLRLMAEKDKAKKDQEVDLYTSYYHKNYTDIATDMTKHSMFQLRVNQIYEEDPTLAPTAIVDAAAKDVKRFYGEEPASESDPPPLPKKKKTVKRAGARTPVPKENKPKTPMEKINEMRHARGLPPIPT